MKNIKISLFVAVFFLPSFAFAQVANDQYVSLLNQLITLLTQEVTLLEQQLTTLQQSQVQTNTQLNQIVQNTTPVVQPTPSVQPTNPVQFGSLPVNQTPVPQNLTLTLSLDKPTIPAAVIVQQDTNEIQQTRTVVITLTLTSNTPIDQNTTFEIHTPIGNVLNDGTQSVDRDFKGVVKYTLPDGNRGSLTPDGKTYTYVEKRYISYFTTVGEVETFTANVGGQTATASFTVQ